MAERYRRSAALDAEVEREVEKVVQRERRKRETADRKRRWDVANGGERRRAGAHGAMVIELSD